MKRLQDLKMVKKLMFVASIFLAGQIICGAFSVWGLYELSDRTEKIYKENLIPVTKLGDLRSLNYKMIALNGAHIQAYDSAAITKTEEEIAAGDSEMEDLLLKYDAIIVNESERKTFDQYKENWSKFKLVREKVLHLSRLFSKDGASELRTKELTPIREAMIASIDSLIEENKKQANESYQTSQDVTLYLTGTTIGAIVIMSLVSLVVVWFVSKLITGNLSNVLDTAKGIRSGNLVMRSTVTAKDEVGELAEVFNQMAGSLEQARDQTDLALKMQAAELSGVTNAIGRVQAFIEFNVDGTIVTANENFLSCVGYSLPEIKGQHHRMFCDATYANSGEYASFWQKLNRGESEIGQYRRIGKGGKEIWLQACYSPILDTNGKVSKVVKFATDITAQKQTAVEMEGLVTETQKVLGRLAENDLTQEMDGTYQGELAKIKTSINAVVHNLTDTITAVREAVEAVSLGAEEITKGNEDLSQRTSQQASALEETSASMEQMTSTVKQNADNAKQANQLAVAARDTADKGGAVTKRAVDAMGEINKSSKKIADIITVIDEIAFQTNLLALNAAVEAARAGEHGRGFAVVAAEVRNLAQRSATAAKEIKGLINESIQCVNDGSELVNQSGKTLEEIVNAVKRVGDIIAEITAASQEQASGIDQVNKAIMSMDETTQQNAALVEQTTSASQSMKEQAKGLLRQVNIFKIEQVARRSRGAATVPIDLTPVTSEESFKPVTQQARPQLLGKKVANPRPAVSASVGVTSGTGKDQGSLEGDFEEF